MMTMTMTCGKTCMIIFTCPPRWVRITAPSSLGRKYTFISNSGGEHILYKQTWWKEGQLQEATDVWAAPMWKARTSTSTWRKWKCRFLREGERERMRTKQLCEIVLMTNGLLLRLQFLSENRKFVSSCLFITLATKGKRGWTLELTNSSVVSWSSDSFLQISLKSTLSCTNLIMRMTVEGKHTIPYEYHATILTRSSSWWCRTEQPPSRPVFVWTPVNASTL